MPTGLIYTVTMDAIAVTAAKDLMRIKVPTDAVGIIHRVKVSQSTEEGDAESEMLPIQLQTSSTDGTGTAATPKKTQGGFPAAGSTAVVDLSADTTLTDILYRESENVMQGWLWEWIPEDMPVISPGGRFVVRLDAAPTDSITFSVVVTIEELGG